MTEALSRDGFLGGRLHVWQPVAGYRAGVDPVLLAAAVQAAPGQSVLELGCGVGVAMLCLATRVPGVSVTGLEVQPAYADLARRNAAQNAIAARIVTGDLAHMPADLKALRFDHVIANPPYFDRGMSTAATDPGRETGMGEVTPLQVWVQEASRRCAPKGYVTVIHRAERLPELLHLMTGRLGSLEVLPLIPRAGRAAKLVILRGRAGGRAGFRLHDGVLMHAGEAHGNDGKNYSATMTSILRDAAALEFPV